MKRLDKILLFASGYGILLVVLALSCSPKVTVHHLDGQKLDSEGPFYSLPVNVIQLQMTVSQVTEEPGRLWFCSELLTLAGFDQGAIEKIRRENEKIYAMPNHRKVTFEISDPKLLVTAVPDPAHTYLIDVKGGFFNQKDITIKLNEIGIITGMDATVTDKTLEYAVTFLEVASTIAPLMLSIPETRPPQPLPRCTGESRVQAHKIVNQISDFGEARKKLITGTGRVSIGGEAFDSMLAEINKMEKQLLEKNFTGYKNKIEWKPLLEYTPLENNEKVLLFSITDKGCIKIPEKNSQNPVVDNLDEIQVPVAIDNVCKIDTDRQDVVIEDISLLITVPADYKENARLEKIRAANYDSSKQEDQGIVYRIPARAKVEVVRKELLPRTNPKTVVMSKPQIAQLGLEATLPAKLGYGKSGYSLEFYDNTGSLKKVGGSSEPIPTTTITKSATAATSIVDSIEDRDIVDLKRKNEEMQLKINKIKLEEELEKLESQD